MYNSMTNPLRLLVCLLPLLLSATVVASGGETSVLAKCPEEPAVEGYYYNNGRYCVRDKETWTRQVEKPTCPDDYELKAGWCRRRFHKKVAPSCPTAAWQLYKKTGQPQCQSPCPPHTNAMNGVCIKPRHTLGSYYMTCPQDTEHAHRVGAYCCSMKLGNCPRTECNIGTPENPVPGRFYYHAESGLCERQVETLARATMPKLPLVHNPKKRACPKGKVPVRSNVCQDPCPKGYRASRGKCVLQYCAFDTTKDKIVECPEGTYPLPQAPL